MFQKEILKKSSVQTVQLKYSLKSFGDIMFLPEFKATARTHIINFEIGVIVVLRVERAIRFVNHRLFCGRRSIAMECRLLSVR